MNPVLLPHLRRRDLLGLGALGALSAGAALCPTGAVRAAEHYPSRAIRLIVAFAPGTGSDALARIVAAAMAPELGQPMLVDNRSGVGGAMGTEQGARAPADGYTLTLATTSTLITNPALNSNVRYRADRDFVAVVGLARTAFVMVTANTADAPRTLAELTQRLHAQPGAFASAGVGTVTHLAAELYLKRARVKSTHVPYRGSGAALTDVAAGQLLFGCDTPVAALPLIRAGKLRALAVTSTQRLHGLPDVPTAAEAGLTDFQVSAWWGLVAPTGTPPHVIARLSDAAMKSLARPQVITQFENQQLEPMPLPSAAFGQLIRTELPTWTDFVRQTGIKLEF